MDVDPAAAAGSVEHNGRTYYFCSKHCVQKFRASPDQFTADSSAGAAPKFPTLTVIQSPGSSAQAPAAPTTERLGPGQLYLPDAS